MRSYASNSPQAAARIVALAMLADGHPSPPEFDAAQRLDLHRRLRLGVAEWQGVMRAVCEDLLSTTHLSWDRCCRVDERTLAQVLAEIEDPRLRRDVLAICCAVVTADDHVTDGEWALLSTALEHWGLQRAMFETGPKRS